MEWFIVNWMAYFQTEWQVTKMNGSCTNWMAIYQNEWITVGWPTANWILGYAQGAWDRLTFLTFDPVFHGRSEFIMADELSVQLRNALLDVSRQLQSYLSDELLEATVYRLKQICRYVLVLVGTNPNLNDLFASITSMLSRLATCENRLHSSGYNAPVHLSGRPGRPKFDISREQLEYFLVFVSMGFLWVQLCRSKQTTSNWMT